MCYLKGLDGISSIVLLLILKIRLILNQVSYLFLIFMILVSSPIFMRFIKYLIFMPFQTTFSCQHLLNL
jgi:hypothetical protein